MAEAATKLVFPSRLDEVPVVQHAIVEAAQQAGFDEQALFAIRLALDEALTNAVRHGNGSDPSKQVIVEFSADAQRLQIEIEDQGPGFAPDEVPDPTAEENLCRPHGRGVMLMKAYMSEVRYNPRGNRVTLIKLRECDQPRE